MKLSAVPIRPRRQPQAYLVNNSTTPLATINLLGTTNSQTNTRATKQSIRSARINAEVKVQVGPVLVGATQTGLRAERVAVCRTEVGDLHDDWTAEALGVARAVGARGQFPAGAACGAGSGAGTDTEFVLRDGGRITGLLDF